VIRFRLVDDHRGAYGVKRICQVWEIDRSSCYGHLARAAARAARALAEDELAQEIAEIHAASGGAYGAIRITRELRDRGPVVNKKRVARIMRERGIARRKRKSPTKADKKAPPAPMELWR
jgi:putative transposase